MWSRIDKTSFWATLPTPTAYSFLKFLPSLKNSDSSNLGIQSHLKLCEFLTVCSTFVFISFAHLDFIFVVWQNTIGTIERYPKLAMTDSDRSNCSSTKSNGQTNQATNRQVFWCILGIYSLSFCWAVYLSLRQVFISHC